jgi:hypothetical protein
MDIKFKAGTIKYVFRVLPGIQITWSRINKNDFAIEFVWLIYGIGMRINLTRIK